MSGLLGITVLCDCSKGRHAIQAAPTPIPGLAVNAAVHYDGQWAITHIPSGCLVAPLFASPEGALHVATLLGGCGDWDRAGSVIAADASMQLLRKAQLADAGLLRATREHPQVDLGRLLKREADAA